MINSLWISPPRKSVWARQVHSVDWAVFLTPVQTKITSVQKYDLQCSYNEPDDKTAYTTNVL